MRKKRCGRQRAERPALEWRESRAVKWQDELCTHTETLATLQWTGLLSDRSTGSARAGQWTFDRPRFFSRDVEIRAVDSHAEAPYAVLYPDWTSGGPVEFADGRTLHWASTNFWGTQWVFMDEAGTPLLRFEDTSPLFQVRTAVTFVQPGLSEADRALLLLLGRYLMVLHAKDTAVVAVATTAACT
jgi:hypothetical protein